jgi:energy-coupling factor transporter ATP-binding protein EcfA2
MTGFQITRLRVEQLRRFREPLELADFSPGLNILAGPNEAGKSTLVRAIRAAFFERYGSSAVADLRPHGESGAAPQVELDFTFQGVPHHLVKRFLSRARCTLQAGSLQLDSGEAEDHLAQMFGFAFAGRGASKPEHWGIPGLLWVEQGTGQELDVSHARSHLQDALQGQAGEAAGALAATGGDDVLLQLRKQRDLLLTKGGKPRADYEAAAEQVQSHQARLAELDAEIRHYQSRVDQLAHLRRAQADEALAPPWVPMRADLAAAQQQRATLQQNEAALQQDRDRHQHLQAQCDLLAQKLQAFEREDAALAQRTAVLAKAAALAQEADAAVGHARAQVDAASTRLQAADRRRQAAEQQARRQRLLRDAALAQADAARCAAHLQRAEQAARALEDLRAQAAAQPAITRADVGRLVQLERAERDAALRRDAVATRLAFRLPEGVQLGLRSHGQSQPLQGQGERWLDAPAVVQLPDGGVLEITPGGKDVAELAQALSAAQSALQAALQTLGVADVAEAQTRLAQAEALQQQVELARKGLGTEAPEGLQPLQQALHAARARVSTAQEAVSRLQLADTDRDADAHAEPVAPAGAEAAAPPAQDEADAAHRAATQHLQAVQAAWTTALERAAMRQADAAAARREQEAVQAVVADPARAPRLQQTHVQWQAARSDLALLGERIAQHQQALQAARPDIVVQDITRLERSIAASLDQSQRRHNEILVLEGALQQAGAQGLEETRATVAGSLAQARRRHAELQRRAEALDLLCSKLEGKRAAALARLQDPLLRRLQHYLPLLMPGAVLHMDAQLAPSTLTRTSARGVPEAGELQSLSFGAREQLGLISRLAYADLLQEAGRPTLLILDDALVHSDTQRLAAMKRVLFDAAQRHQVLLFTCHPESWRDAGVAIRTL